MNFCKYELKNCKLIEIATGKELLTFDARAIKEKTTKGGFAGSGIASGSHSYSIATPTFFNFEPYNHKAVVEGVDYIITSKHPITPRQLGERFVVMQKKEMVLELE